MKKTLLAASALALMGAAIASAQVVEQPGFGDNWSLGIEGGVTTPIKNNPFFPSMRPIVGVHLAKQISPVFGLGVEAQGAINTSNWKGRVHSSTAFDQSYVGVYGTADLFNLFGGYSCKVRPFTIEAMAGAGWGYDYFNTKVDAAKGYNYFGTKAGLNFNFNVSDHVTIAVSPSIYYNMIGEHNGNTMVAYDANKAQFNLMAGVTYHIGGNGFKCVRAYDQAEVDGLNAQVNELRAAVEAEGVALAASQADNAALAAQLAACQNQKPQVIKEVKNELNSVRFVFFRVGSSKVTADQQPNIEMIADYMKNHPKSTVVIKGYASPEGNYDFNVKLAQSRAESVKSQLVSKYKIAPDRITAEGEGIGHMFEEDSWNRVSICTLESNN